MLEYARIYCQQRSGVPDIQQARRLRSVLLCRFHAYHLSNANAMGFLSIAGRLLGKAAALPFSHGKTKLTMGLSRQKGPAMSKNKSQSRLNQY